MQIDVNVGAYTLAAATVTTALQIIAASGTKPKCGMVDRGGGREPIEISFNGVSATDEPVRVRILRQTTAIGGTPTAVTPVKHLNGENGTIQTTAAKKASSGDAEPTASDVYYDQYLHPQGRHFIAKQFVIEQGERLGFEFTAPQSQEVSIHVPADD